MKTRSGKYSQSEDPVEGREFSEYQAYLKRTEPAKNAIARKLGLSDEQAQRYIDDLEKMDKKNAMNQLKNITFKLRLDLRRWSKFSPKRWERYLERYPTHRPDGQKYITNYIAPRGQTLIIKYIKKQ